MTYSSVSIRRIIEAVKYFCKLTTPHDFLVSVSFAAAICNKICEVSFCYCRDTVLNRPFPSCFEPRYESEAKYKVFIMKISFHLYANKPIFI